VVAKCRLWFVRSVFERSGESQCVWHVDALNFLEALLTCFLRVFVFGNDIGFR